MSTPLHDLKAALRRLDLSENQQAIFLSLVQEGPGTARTLAGRTGLTRPSVYDQLKALRQNGLVVELHIDGTTQFAAVDLKLLDNLLADKIERIERSRASLQATLADLTKTFHTVSPKIRFFEGGDEVKNILKDVLFNMPRDIHITWPSAAMAEVFDAAYLAWFAERLQTHGVTIQLTATSNHPFTGYKKYSRLRTEPAMASILYGNRVAHISSPAESFGFIVESREYALLQ